MKNLYYKAFLYIFILTIFLRSIRPLLTASNYSVKFKYKVFFLEIIFLLKVIYGFVLHKKIKEEKFLGYMVSFPSYLDFFYLFVEMFGAQEYMFISSKKSPVIVDLGSNWGMSVIYFKHFHPDASIIAVEANKHTAEYLKENIERNKFSKVKIYNVVVAEKKGVHEFFVNNKSDGWSLSDNGVSDFVGSRSDFSKISVKAIQLSSLINREIDLLKLDIEGMEGEVLNEAQKKLPNVKEITMEYHGGINPLKNSFDRIDSILKKTGFTYTVSSSKSLLHRNNNTGLRILHAKSKNYTFKNV